MEARKPTTDPWVLGNLQVRPELDQFSSDRSQGIITIESTNPDFAGAIEDLRSAKARELALAYGASQGVVNSGIDGNVAAFPVNSQGVPLDKVSGPNGQPLPPAHPLRAVSAYRAMIKIRRNSLR
jgi:hypothetical protein